MSMTIVSGYNCALANVAMFYPALFFCSLSYIRIEHVFFLNFLGGGVLEIFLILFSFLFKK